MYTISIILIIMMAVFMVRIDNMKVTEFMVYLPTFIALFVVLIIQVLSQFGGTIG